MDLIVGGDLLRPTVADEARVLLPVKVVGSRVHVSVIVWDVMLLIH